MSGLFFAGSGKVQLSVVEQTVIPLTSVFSPPAENLSAPMSFPYESPRNCATTVTVSPALIRTLVVDDEPIARQVLRDELGVFGDVQIAGEAANGNEALWRNRPASSRIWYSSISRCQAWAALM